MIVDANVLLYAVDVDSTFHEPARDWLEEAVNGPVRVGLPWESLTAFLRIATHPRATRRPLGPVEAWAFVADWLNADNTWVPTATSSHADVLRDLVVRGDLRGNLVPDAHLAALAIEHGVAVCSTDTDFARFPQLRWINPVARR